MAGLLRLSCIGNPVPTVLSCHVPALLSQAPLSCPCCHILIDFSRLSYILWMPCLSCRVLVAMFWLFCPLCPDYADLSQLSCPEFPVLVVLSGCSATVILFPLSCPGCPVPVVLSQLY
jgi:hypothetical protein